MDAIEQPSPDAQLAAARRHLEPQPLAPAAAADRHPARRLGAPRRTLGAQVALVQEAVPPADLPRERAVYGEIAGHRNWGSAVVALDPTIAIEPIRSVRMPWSRRRYLLANAHPGSVAVAQLTVPGIQPITLVSVYGVLGRLGRRVDAPRRGRPRAAVRLAAGRAGDPRRRPQRVAGDGGPAGTSPAPRRCSARSAARLVEAKTLVADPPAAVARLPVRPARRAATSRHGAGRARPPVRLAGLAGQVTACRSTGRRDRGPVGPRAARARPRAVAERTPHVWDEESFAEEIGRRHGPAARRGRRAARELGGAKERELASGDGRHDAEADPLPDQRRHRRARADVPGGPQPRAEGQPADDLDPRRWHGRRLAGGDAPPAVRHQDARHELRSALNAIAGVEIPQWQVNGWPRFPLSALEDPANLVRFVAVLDRIATESHTVPATPTRRRMRPRPMRRRPRLQRTGG